MKTNLSVILAVVLFIFLASCSQLNSNNKQEVVTQAHDPNTIYLLPWKNNETGAHSITQDYSEPAKHSGYPGIHAIDVGMFNGTQILAARDGYAEVLRNNICGIHIRVRHLDNSYAFYCHLSSAAIQNGVDVKTGTIIGYSGDTGTPGSFHLHFEVTDAPGHGWNGKSYKVKFKEVIESGVCDTEFTGQCYPKLGHTYKSQNVVGGIPTQSGITFIPAVLTGLF